MDDNVMRRYATTSTEARHYVQYDQGNGLFTLKGRSHGAIFVNATAIWKMGGVDVYETVHMVQLQYRSGTFVCDIAHGMTFIPILFDCNVWFKYT